MAATGDLSFHAGHFHPAKAPGGSFLAVPAYLAIYQVERLIGADPDDWWTLTVNAWLTSVLSVGLLAALTVVLLFRMAMRLSGGRALPSTLTALAFALGTPFFPYATMLYEHAPSPSCSSAAFSLLAVEARDVPVDGTARLPCAAASGRPRRGVCGLAAVGRTTRWPPSWCSSSPTSSSALRRTRGLGCGSRSGLLGPFLVLCAYNVAAFGTPFTTNYAFEDPQFLEGGRRRSSASSASRDLEAVIPWPSFLRSGDLPCGAGRFSSASSGSSPGSAPAGCGRSGGSSSRSSPSSSPSSRPSTGGTADGAEPPIPRPRPPLPRASPPCLRFAALAASSFVRRECRSRSTCSSSRWTRRRRWGSLPSPGPGPRRLAATAQSSSTSGRSSPGDGPRPSSRRSGTPCSPPTTPPGLAGGAAEVRARSSADLRRQIDGAIARGRRRRSSSGEARRGPPGSRSLRYPPSSGRCPRTRSGSTRARMYQAYPPGSPEARWNSFNVGGVRLPGEPLEPRAAAAPRGDPRLARHPRRAPAGRRAASVLSGLHRAASRRQGTGRARWRTEPGCPPARPRRAPARAPSRSRRA